ncbi:MAG: DUF3658 domain-containing protein [Ginsengibacter sp.]
MHVVFQQKAKEILEQGFASDDSIDHNIKYLKSDYSLGPVEFPFSKETFEKRNDWWKNISGEEDDLSVVKNNEDDFGLINDIKIILENNPEEQLWIWIAPNKEDVSGYYFLLSQFSEHLGQVYVVWLNNLPFINEKGNIFYPRYISEIPSREFIKAKKLFRLITPGEMEVDLDEWDKLCRENKSVRILKDHKKIIQDDEDYFDRNLLNLVTPERQKVSKVIQQFNHKSLDNIPEEYLVWRIKIMIENGSIDSQGDIYNKKEWEVKKESEGENITE